jgi:hypothetical protein
VRTARIAVSGSGRKHSLSPFQVTRIASVLSDGTDAEAWSGAERTVEGMTGLSSEQSKSVVAVELHQRAAQVSGVGRVALALALAAVGVNAEVVEPCHDPPVNIYLT